MEREFHVEVVHRERAVYRVHAPDRETAERVAADRWRHGEPGEAPGYDWSEMISCRAHDAPDTERALQDVELVYRFITERERLIQQIGGDPFNPAASDAISADQVAADLGWVLRSAEGTTTPDVTRATAALERLCACQRVVCFSRPRLRLRERGEIRLYCTPQYLERLSRDVEAEEAQAV